MTDLVYYLLCGICVAMVLLGINLMSKVKLSVTGNALSALAMAGAMAVTVFRYGIFSHFSSAEKEFEDNDAAGRFEGEVKDIAAMIDKLRPYSLILLNETFQTTAYTEGAEGMKLILDALPMNGSKYIFVTHMLTVFKLFGEDSAEAVMLKTGEDCEKYKLIPFVLPKETT